jgi:GTP-binding protein HflX
VVVLVPERAGASHTPRTGNGKVHHRATVHSTQDRLAEAVGLAKAIALEVAAAEIVPLYRPRPATLFGSGKVAELGELVSQHGTGLAVIDHALSPVQQRNLEKAWNCKVVDRTGLILEIFGARALTREGRLQVELAHLTYQKSRLVRTWTHLERQRGGFGFLGGPGEAQIETDRRLIDERITAIRRELQVVVKTRGLQRARRKRVPYPVIAIVGYTNAGKSTLFNRLTGASVSAKDQVFQTLDPTMRGLDLPSGRRVMLSDTVGFISELPTTLVAAFRATLEEVVEADLVLHVRDISHPETEAQRRDVEMLLSSLGVSPAAGTIEAWNKSDLLASAKRAEAERALLRADNQPVLLSAATGEGLNALRDRLEAQLGAGDEILTLDISPRDGRLLSWLHAHAEVLREETADTGTTTARFRIDPANRGKLESQLKRLSR